MAAVSSLEAWREARELIRLGQPGKAAATLKSAKALSVTTEESWQLGVQALAAMTVGDVETARRDVSVMRGMKDMPEIAKIAVEARWMQLCALPCDAPVRSFDDVKGAPVPVQARYLEGISRVDRKAAVKWARAAWQEGSWKDGALPQQERAGLASAIYSALEEGGDRGGAHAVEVLVWEQMPMEPRVAYVVRGVDENAMVKERGAMGLLAHLEAMQEAHQNGEVVRLAGVLCAGKPLVDGKLCPSADAAVRCRAGFAYGKALRQARKTVDAEAVLDVVARSCPELRERALFLAARAQMAIKGAGDRAVTTCGTLAKEFPESALADDAWVMAGDVLERVEKLDDAEKAWARATGSGDMAFAAMRRLVMLELRRGRNDVVTARLDAMARAAEGRDAAALRWARYWKARTAKNPAQMIAGLESLVDTEPMSVEAALARGVLKAQGVGPGPVWNVPAEGPVTTGKRDAAGDALLRVGLDADAVDVLRAALRRDGDAGIARALIDAGDAATASKWARKALAGALAAKPDAAGVATWRLAYPRAHRRAIEDAADATGLPHALLFALAREESAFDHSVNSLSGAIGLFQLLPATAVTEAITLHITLANEAALKEPDVNARIGASYLARMVRQLKGNPALGLAAYNAGPGAVRKWLAADPEVPLDLFIERIPIDETREYVRRVLESFAVYSSMEGVGLVLPERAGEPLGR